MTGYVFLEYSGVKRYPLASETICLSNQSVTKTDFAQTKSNYFTE